MAGAATRDENRTACPAKLGSRCGRARWYGRFSFQDEAAGSSPARPTTPGLTWGNARRWSSFNGGCFREGLRTAVLERIPALLSSDDCGSRVEREAQGQVGGQVLWRVRVKVVGEGGSCGRLWVGKGQDSCCLMLRSSNAVHMLGSLLVRAQWADRGGHLASPPPWRSTATTWIGRSVRPASGYSREAQAAGRRRVERARASWCCWWCYLRWWRPSCRPRLACRSGRRRPAPPGWTWPSGVGPRPG